MKGIYSLWLLCALCSPYSQITAQSITFQKTYGGVGNESGNHVIITGAGYLIAGQTTSPTTGNLDAYLLRVNAAGDIMWQRTYGGSQDDAFTLVTEANDGGFLAMGDTRSAGAGGKDVLLVKTDANGALQWTKTFGGSSDEIATNQGKIVKLTDGYLISGIRNLSGTLHSYFVRLSNAGSVVWTKSLISPDNFSNFLVGSYVVGDTLYAGGAINNDGCFAKLDVNTGNILFLRTFPQTFNDALYNICPTQDGHLLLSEATWTASGNAEIGQWLMKIEHDGTVLWSKVYGQSGISLRGRAESVADGGFILTPYTNSFNTASSANLAKVDANGTLLWAYSYGGPSDDQFWNALPTNDGGFIAVGSTYDPVSGQDNILLVKTNAEGQVQGCSPDMLDLSTVDLPATAAVQSLTSGAFAAGVNWNLATQSGTLAAFNQCDQPGPDTLSGVVNDYTPVIGFSCDSSLLQVGSAAEFSPGDKVLLIQMQGASVDVSNTANFGAVLDFGSAGNYAFNRIQSVSGNDIQLQFALTNTYDVAGKVQLIRVPEYVDATTGSLSCKAWDGSTGGVLAIDVANTLTLAGDVDVRAKGFRGGFYVNSTATSYHETQFFYPPAAYLAAAKGEGVAIIPSDKSYGRGRAANGGGGGNAANAGGGGGGNAGNGGHGGEEYYNTPFAPTPGTQGLGGNKAFENSPDRIIMGGGGGAGHSNDFQGSSGGNGGGIIILKAKTVESNGQVLHAMGEDIFGPGGTNVNDGQGGGGAGGTILLDAETVNGALLCDVQGGRGGDCLFYVQSQIIGPGGGGSGGKIMIPQVWPSLFVEIAGGSHGIANQNLSNESQNGESGKILTGLILTVDTLGLLPTLELEVLAPTCLLPGQITVLNEPASLFSLNNGAFQSNPTFSNLEPGSYLVTVQDSLNSCAKDSTITLIRQDSIIKTTTQLPICPGETIVLGGVAYTQAGLVVLTIPAAVAGCDTLATYDLIRAENVVLENTLVFCPGDSVLVNGLYYTQADTAIAYTISASIGCDTVVEVFLQYAPPPTVTKVISFCPGGAVSIDGTIYTQPGTVMGILPAITGCDTLTTYVLQFAPPPTVTRTLSFCPGDSIIISGVAYTQPGTVAGVIPAATGCDTLATYVLQFAPQPTVTSMIAFCPGESVTIDGLVYTQPGTVAGVIPAATGCDTLATYVLQFAPQPTVSQIIEFCAGDSVMIGGVNYTQPGTVGLLLPAATGCDTVVTYTLQYLVASSPTAIVLTCPNDIYVDADPGVGSVVVDYTTPTATSNCPCPGVALTLQQGLPSGGSFPIDSTDVCYNAQDSCGNSITCCFKVRVQEIPACDIKVINCIKYELLSITRDAQQRKTYRIRTTNNCANRLLYLAVQLPDGLVAKQPAHNTIYTAPGGRTYLVRNPNYSPFYSLRYASVSDSIRNGESDIFQYTLPAQADPDYIHVTVRLEPQIFYEAHLNTFNCPVEDESNANAPLSERESGRQGAGAGFRLFPNPTDGVLFADLSAWSGQKVQLRVLSIQGHLLRSAQVLAGNEAQLLELPASLANGLYLLEVTSVDGQKSTQRFIMQH